MAKKIIVNVILLCMVINVFSVMPTLAYGDELTAFAVFGSAASSSGFKSVIVGDGSKTQPEISEKSGRTCYLLSKNSPHISLSVAEEMKNHDGSEYILEIDYYEELNAGFRVVYDSKTQEEPLEVGQVYHDFNGVWKTVSYTLKDAAFQERIDDKYDIRITVDFAGQYPLISQGIGAVRLVKKVERNPIYAQSTTEQVGHTFRWFDEEKIISTTFENLSDDKFTATVKHRLIDTNGIARFETTENINFEPHEVRETTFDFGELQYCDIYKHYVDIEIAEREISSQFVPLQIAVVKTDPDGIKKESAYWSVHMDKYTNEQNVEMAELLSYTNITGVRYNLTWRDIEQQKGVYTWGGTAAKALEAFKYLKKYGIKFLPLIFGSSTQHVESYTSLPKTEAQLNAYAAHLKNIIDTIGDDVDFYEIWNEANIGQFNKDYSLGGSAFVPVFKTAVDTIRKYDPTAEIGAIALAGPANDPAIKYWTEALDAGLAESKPDAVILHPYTDPYGKYPEKTGVAEKLQWYKDDYKKRTGESIDIWLTEYGVTANRHKHTPTYREKGAADVRSTILFESKGISDLSSMYVFEEDMLLDAPNSGGRFGAVTGFKKEFMKYGKNLIPNEAFLMNSAYYYVAADAEYVKNYEFNDSQILLTHLKSNKFKGDVLTLHRIDGEELITLNLGTDKITLYDCKGNSQEVYGENGMFTFVAEFAPKYIVGNIPTIQQELTGTHLVDMDKLNVSSVKGDIVNISFENNTGFNVEPQIYAPDEIKFISVEYDNKAKGNKGIISLKNKLSTGTKAYINVMFYDESGSLIQSTDLLIKGVDFAESKLKIEPNIAGNELIWKGTFDITNGSHENPVSGYMKIISPTQYVDNKQYEFLIPKGRTQRLSIPITNLTRCEQSTITYEIVNSNGEVLTLYDTVSPVVAMYNETKPTIDGEIKKGEWQQAAKLYADTSDRLQKFTGWKGPDDLSMYSVVNWDTEYLYVLTEVTDDTHYVVQDIMNSWNDDSIQFGVYYTSSENIANGNIPSAYTKLIAALVPGGAQIASHSFQDAIVGISQGVLEDGVVAVKRTGNKTVYELAVPWKYITGNTMPKNGDYLGFSIMANDNDGTGRRGWIEYGSGLGMGNNTGLFTVMKLM